MATASIWVPLSPSEIWPYVSEITNFSRFLSNVRQIRRLGDGLCEFQFSGLLGIPIHWHAQTTTNPGEGLNWESTTGPLKTAGFLLLQPQNGGSFITVHLEYHPPAGAIKEMFDQLFKDPQKTLEEDLEKLGMILVQQPSHDQM